MSKYKSDNLLISNRIIFKDLNNNLFIDYTIYLYFLLKMKEGVYMMKKNLKFKFKKDFGREDIQNILKLMLYSKEYFKNSYKNYLE